MSRCMKLFSRKLIVDNMIYCNPGIKMGEDVNIVLPALLDSRRLVILKEALHYHYFYNDSSMVHKYDAGMYDGICLLIDAIKEIFNSKSITDWQEPVSYTHLCFSLPVWDCPYGLPVMSRMRGLFIHMTVFLPDVLQA